MSINGKWKITKRHSPFPESKHCNANSISQKSLESFSEDDRLQRITLSNCRRYNKTVITIVWPTFDSVINTQGVITTSVPMENEHNRDDDFRHNDHIRPLCCPHLSARQIADHAITLGQSIYPVNRTQTAPSMTNLNIDKPFHLISKMSVGTIDMTSSTNLFLDKSTTMSLV